MLSEKAYFRVLDEQLPMAQRLKHMSYRQFWLRDIDISNNDRRRLMVTSWDKMGIVTEQPGPSDHGEAGLPDRFWVETGRSQSFAANDPTWKQVLRAENVEEAERLRKVAAGVEGVEESRAEAVFQHAEVVPAFPATAAVEPEEEIGHPLRRELDQHSVVRSDAPCAVVVGGGPAGAVAALVLARRGVRAVVLESRPAPGPNLHDRRRPARPTVGRRPSGRMAAEPRGVLRDARPGGDPRVPSASSAGHAIADLLAGRTDARLAYLDLLQDAYGAYLDLQRRHYIAEHRWPDAPFWRRRHAPRYTLEPIR